MEWLLSLGLVSSSVHRPIAHKSAKLQLFPHTTKPACHRMPPEYKGEPKRLFATATRRTSLNSGILGVFYFERVHECATRRPFRVEALGTLDHNQVSLFCLSLPSSPIFSVSLQKPPRKEAHDILELRSVMLDLLIET